MKKKKASAPDRATARRQFLALRPLRNPDIEWEENEERVVLAVKRANNWKTKLANILFPIPEVHHVALDAIGSDVWRWADGEHTIGEMAKKLANRYKIGNREAELSLQQFFKDLGRRGYVGFVVEPK